MFEEYIRFAWIVVVTAGSVVIVCRVALELLLRAAKRRARFVVAPRGDAPINVDQQAATRRLQLAREQRVFSAMRRGKA